MLTSETKKKIDGLRDTLVGKLPVPTDQVRQITLAMIYKFMSDIDEENTGEFGSKSFFAGEYKKYMWKRLLDRSLSAHERVVLYSESLEKMNLNPNIPQLFREIFKGAFLPFKDPAVLDLFLKGIDEFKYEHSEDLGDAFEYLLSVMGSQGDAGQFRTPRHIIDFIVRAVDPKKTDRVLDPACGTAGFLISAYKHILIQNKEKDSDRPGSGLTTNERRQLAKNFTGYDISHEMVRLSLVNMYLHLFKDPKIYEYDTLASLDRWDDDFDCILANPPFMSPKGGIRPHTRFSIQANRSEVLFVDYIAEHLAPNGRAGVIVPEGIIFQSQNAYKQLRKMLVEECLVAVVSLPAGVFQPYSGVKTSILILDKSLAKKANTIAFFKVENDGFGLGAQRREIDKNDLPLAHAEISEYLRRLRAGKSAADFKPALGLIVSKGKIIANGDYNLSSERYRESVDRQTTFPKINLGELLKLKFGTRITKKNNEGTLFPVYGGGGESFRTDSFTRENDVVISRFAMSAECVRIVTGKFYLLDSGFTFSIADSFAGRATKPFVVQVLLNSQNQIYNCARGHAQKNIDVDAFKSIEIPLPPMEVQKDIVAEIEGYQKVINGARAVIENYRPHIPIHPDWPIIQLGEICSFKNGLNFNKISAGHTVKIIGVSDFQANLYAPLADLDEVHLDAPLAKEYLVKGGDILFVRSNGNPGLVGRSVIVPPPLEPTTFSGFTIRGRIEDKRALPLFYAQFFKSRDFAEMIKTVGRGANIRNLSQGILNELKVPLPPLATQQAIVAEIEAEQALVAANRDLITRFEQKIQSKLAKIWGEG